MEFQQPVLKFKNDDLLPFISLRTIEYHYGKHHLTYINNLNNLIKDNEYANASLEEIVRKSDGALFNNAAQVYNHNFYFDQFTNAKTEPTAKFIDLLSANELTLDTLKEKMISAAIALFGSGWVWLVINENSKLEIKSYSNAGNPLKENLKPIMTIDVWEHAYYIDYFNNRKLYCENFWNYLDWNFIEKQF